MNNKDFKNLQNSLYSDILPPPESLKHSRGEGLGTHKSLNHTPDLSDSEHTKSSQDSKDECFRMTTSRHSERSEESTCDKEILRSLHSLRMTNNKTITKWAKTATLSLAMSFVITQCAIAAEPILPAIDSIPEANRTEYGYKDLEGAVPYYYKWSNTSTGTILVQTTVDEAEITYWADPLRVADDNFEIINGQDVNKDFIGNQSAISNTYREIGNITGDFIGNQNAIYNYRGSIGDITGNFIKNQFSTINNQNTIGGAIYNNSYITAGASMGNIKGNFIGNFAYSQEYGSWGGAIANTADYHPATSATISIKDINANFINNYALGATEAKGGAIYNIGIIGSRDELNNITGGIINSTFVGNHATVTNEDGIAQGGAIWTTRNLNIIAKDGGQSVFSGNYTEANGVKTPNAIYVEGTRLYSTQTSIVSINTDKIIYQEANVIIPTITLNSNTNGVILFDDQIEGGLNNKGTVNTYQMDILGIAQDFKDEMYSDLGLSDDATVSEVVDAYIAFMQKQYPDEELPENVKALVLQQFIDSGIVEISDPELISSEIKSGYDLKITGDSTGKVILNNDVINANISLDNTNLYLGRENVFDQSQSLSLNSGSIYLNNQSVGTMHVPTLNLNGNTNISVDADLANKSMDRITADNYNITNQNSTSTMLCFYLTQKKMLQISSSPIKNLLLM